MQLVLIAASEVVVLEVIRGTLLSFLHQHQLTAQCRDAFVSSKVEDRSRAPKVGLLMKSDKKGELFCAAILQGTPATYKYARFNC